jgi:hypothetical protein
MHPSQREYRAAALGGIGHFCGCARTAKHVIAELARRSLWVATRTERLPGPAAEARETRRYRKMKLRNRSARSIRWRAKPRRFFDVLLELVRGFSLAPGVAALAVNVRRLLHCFAGCAAILARAYRTRTNRMSALVGFVGHDVSLAARPVSAAHHTQPCCRANAEAAYRAGSVFGGGSRISCRTAGPDADYVEVWMNQAPAAIMPSPMAAATIRPCKGPA